MQIREQSYNLLLQKKQKHPFNVNIMKLAATMAWPIRREASTGILFSSWPAWLCSGHTGCIKHFLALWWMWLSSFPVWENGEGLMVIQVPVTFSKLPVKQRKAAGEGWNQEEGIYESVYTHIHTLLTLSFTLPRRTQEWLKCCHTNTWTLRVKSRTYICKLVHLLHVKSKKF